MPFLVQEGARVWELCQPLLEGLNAKPNQPCPAEITEQIEEFFQVSQCNPGMKAVLRVDWLSPEHYQQSASKPHQFEIQEEIFTEKAIEYLGRQVISRLIDTFDRKVREYITAELLNKMNVLHQAMALLEEVVNVSSIVLFTFTL